ncbi:MAG: PAS domain-containing protein [Alphaproteobacteria bacterium]|nr:PAS domain-containing protein [Alphaproteobacteria bacterium]
MMDGGVKKNSGMLTSLRGLFGGDQGDKGRMLDLLGQIEAIHRSQAVIEFELDGTIITANQNFLNAMGYQLEEVKGRHHSMFAEADYAASNDYKMFWEKLRNGQFEAGEFRRLGKNGKEVWINASYNPIMDGNGRPFKVVKYATDITQQKLIAAENAEIAKIKIALDGAKVNVMIADNDFNIIYMNKSMQEMMDAAEADIRKDLPNFDASKLIGTNIDGFHANPSHQRKLAGGLRDTFTSRIKIGGRTFDLIANPVIDRDGERFGTSVEWSDVTERLAAEEAAAAIAAENARIKIALDGCSTNVMVADADTNIVYMNKAVESMLRSVESELQRSLPNFKVDTVVGSSFDVFHKNPAHQRSLLGALTSTYNAEIKVGSLQFNLIANPVMDEKGNRLGSIVEWRNITEERQVESEVAHVVDAVAAGDFTRRIATDGKEGFMLNLATGMNTISETCETGLAEVVEVLKALAEGDLTQRIHNDYEGTFDELKQSCNTTSEQLADIVSRIIESANEVSGAAGEITAGSADLSQRTETQASSLEETAAAMEEMAATVRTNSENAQQANQQGINARDVATEGGRVVEEAVTAMANIEESSQKISDIIGVIDEIAFQTNLLALNAAVEAARAGDAGKGFAVVASEVRTLAQRSSDAAKNIKELIVDSGNQVQSGVKLVNEAGKSLKEIVESIKSVTEIVSEIAAASKEQATGIEEINSAVTEMDEMTQQNSALVEENTAAARALEEQAESMRDDMSYFTVDEVGEFEEVRAIRGRKPQALPKPQKATKAKPKKKAAPKKAPKPTVVDDDDDWSEF